MEFCDKKYGLERAGPWVLGHTHQLPISEFNLYYKNGCPRPYVQLNNSCPSATLGPKSSDIDKRATHEPWEIVHVCVCVSMCDVKLT